MDLLEEHFEALINMFFGGALAIAAVLVFIKHRSIPAMAILLLFSAVFTALGLLGLGGLIAREWVRVSCNAALGVFLIIVSMSTLSAPPSLRFPNWTKWASLAFGVGLLLSAVVVGLGYSWR